MTAQCARCPTTLRRTSAHRLDHIIALAVAAFILLVVMCSTNLMSVETAGISHVADLFSGPEELVRRNMAGLGLVVVFVTVIAPFGRLVGMLYVLIRSHETTPPRHLRRVFALTLVPEYFERCGFTLTSLGRLPEKSASECPICPKRFACDEQAMLLHLDGTKPQALRPGEPWGYTRIFLGREPGRESA